MKKYLQNTLLVSAFIPVLALSTLGLNIVSDNSTNSNNVVELKELKVNSDQDQSVDALRKQKADKIDAYFESKSAPLAGHGMQFVLVAEKYGLPYNFLPAIAMRESTGGKFAYNTNPFGWASAKVRFSNFDEAIEVVGKNLGGANPKTARYYSNNNIKKKLWYYNGSVIEGYEDQVISIMNTIDKVDPVKATLADNS
jgi:hypothetical protein